MRRSLSQRQLIRRVARRWREQYCRNGEWSTTQSGSARDTYERLLALDVDTAAPSDVEAIIGNPSWTSHFCGECADYVSVAVEFCETGEGVTLCRNCLRDALELLEPALVTDAVAKGRDVL